MALRYTVSSVIGLSIILFISSSTSAGVYCYRDKKGVWHFTNIKTDKKYRLYFRTTGKNRKKPAEYLRKYEGIIKQASNRFKVESFLSRQSSRLNPTLTQ
jgi:hypothetical protein